MRPLSLHLLALSGDEYSLFTKSLQELVLLNDDEAPSIEDNQKYYERPIIGVRETKAWLRGRYPDVSLSNIDLVSYTINPLPTVRWCESRSSCYFILSLDLKIVWAVANSLWLWDWWYTFHWVIRLKESSHSLKVCSSCFHQCNGYYSFVNNNKCYSKSKINFKCSIHKASFRRTINKVGKEETKDEYKHKFFGLEI